MAQMPRVCWLCIIYRKAFDRNFLWCVQSEVLAHKQWAESKGRLTRNMDFCTREVCCKSTGKIISLQHSEGGREIDKFSYLGILTNNGGKHFESTAVRLRIGWK